MSETKYCAIKLHYCRSK